MRSTHRLSPMNVQPPRTVPSVRWGPAAFCLQLETRMTAGACSRAHPRDFDSCRARGKGTVFRSVTPEYKTTFWHRKMSHRAPADAVFLRGSGALKRGACGCCAHTPPWVARSARVVVGTARAALARREAQKRTRGTSSTTTKRCVTRLMLRVRTVLVAAHGSTYTGGVCLALAELHTCAHCRHAVTRPQGARRHCWDSVGQD